MATFSFSVADGHPVVLKPEEDGTTINLTSATVVAGSKRCTVRMKSDYDERFAVAVLIPGKKDNQAMDFKLGAAEEEVEVTVDGGATVVVSGYTLVPREFDDLLNDDDDSAERGEEVARTRYGSVKVVEGALDDDSSDDDDFEDGALDDDGGDSSSSEEDDYVAAAAAAADEDDFGVRPLLTTRAAPAAPPKKRKAEAAAPTPKKKRAASAELAAASTPTANPLASAASTPAASAFKESIATFLRENGQSPLARLGNSCKRPAEVKSKLKAFLVENSDMFVIDGDRVGLV